MGEETQALGRAIQQARQKAGLTQQQLCNAANLSYSTLAKIERGAIKTPSAFTVLQIAQVLGISMDGLMGATVHTDSASVQSNKRTSKTGIKFIYFDINGCLVRFYQAAFTELSHKTGVSSDLVESAFWHYNDAVCRGEMTMSEFNQNLANRLGLKSVNWMDYYMNAVEPIQEMKEVVQWASNHYYVGLLSNIMPGFIDKMLEIGKLPRVKYDAIVDSSQVGAIKPEEAIYMIASSETDVNPEEILLIDDSRANLMAAERLNWKVLWFDDYRPADSADRIKALLEF